MANKEHYSYKPLSRPSNIRLIRLESRGTNHKHEDQTLRISLIEVDLGQNPVYEALSYTWGDLKDKLPVVVDGKVLEITISLFFFLRQLSEQPPWGGGEVLVWADQISINQKSIPERNQQVAIMANIYQQSRQTRVWLGQSHKYAHLTFSLFERMVPLMKKEIILDDKHLAEARVHAEAFLAHCQAAGISESEVQECIQRTLDHPWFSRAWILQEAALSPHTILHVGSKSVQLECLDMTMIALLSLHRSRTGLFDDFWIFKSIAFRTLSNIRFCRGMNMSKNMLLGRREFLNTLQRMSKTVACSDPRDRVFAFLALQAIDGPLLPPADYALSRNQVYCQTSASLSNFTGNLDILGLVQRTVIHGIHQLDTGLPSWAVDWQHGDDSQGAPLTMLSHGYNACRKFHYVPNRTTIDSANLVVKGRIIDTVGARAPWNTEYIFGGSFRLGLEAVTKERLLSSVHGLYKQLGAKAPDDTIKLYSRAAEVSLAYDPARDRELCESTELEQEIQKAWTSYQKDNAFPKSHQASRPSRPTGSFSIEDDEAELFRYQHEPGDARQIRTGQGAKLQKLRSMSQRVRKRSLCLTEKLLLGMVPWISKSGDVICILHGSSVPVVLRKSENRWDDRYSVIGQCYLEEWMFGENVNWSEHEADLFELE